jgi:hypothetical protein
MNRVFVLRSSKERGHVIDILQGLDLSQRYELVLRLHKSRRSKSQNARYWAIIGVIAADTGHTAEELHEYCKREFLGLEVVHIFGKEHERTRSTTGMNTKEFSDYCERVEAWAVSELGVEL